MDEMLRASGRSRAPGRGGAWSCGGGVGGRRKAHADDSRAGRWEEPRQTGSGRPASEDEGSREAEQRQMQEREAHGWPGCGPGLPRGRRGPGANGKAPAITWITSSRVLLTVPDGLRAIRRPPGSARAKASRALARTSFAARADRQAECGRGQRPPGGSQARSGRSAPQSIDSNGVIAASKRSVTTSDASVPSTPSRSAGPRG